ncbi:MAG: glutamine-hydrolyzing carbamoyl-phosphate synthase small subunit [Acidobacteriia bacterium]|nr:glutamine-hydrolyzing carbamoyl-phosphate synthase small subunit [Terriglobia bacterium]
MKAILALEDGRTFTGCAFGAEGEVCGEVVFNTSLSGYQEILTDPSYAGQIVVMTYPHIGNYGMNREDEESGKPFVQGFVAREFSAFTSNWRALESLEEYLKQHGIVSMSEVDTRAIVRHIRSRGAMRGIVSSVDLDGQRLAERARREPGMLGQDLASAVSCQAPYAWPDPPGAPPDRFRVVAYDFGIKRTILANLARSGCSVVVVPAQTGVDETLSLRPDGIFLSNGPGDPAPLSYAADTVRGLLGKVPLFGICLGHQIMGLALGGKTYKLKFGHRGANQPVKNARTGRVEITAQNHGFAVDVDSLNLRRVEPTHFNLNDQTLEGIRHLQVPAFSVQYHPEASPGPHDSHYLFTEFKRLMAEFRR